MRASEPPRPLAKSFVDEMLVALESIDAPPARDENVHLPKGEKSLVFDAGDRPSDEIEIVVDFEEPDPRDPLAALASSVDELAAFASIR